MKKLLLTSAGFENPKIAEIFLKLVNKPASKTKVLFIPVAARTKEELFYANKSKEELIAMGVPDENIINFDLDRKLTDKEQKDIDAIYVCGGNTFYLLHKVRESGFDEIIKKLINTGVVYIGASAGSMILGPDIGLTAVPDQNDINMQDTTGLNVVDVAISPHYNMEERKMVRGWIDKANYKILPLTDSQGFLVVDNKSEIIE